MHCTFEPAIQWDCVKSVIEIVRQGEVGDGQIAEAVQHASCFAGCAAALLSKKDPEDGDGMFNKAPVNYSGLSPEELCNELESVMPKGATKEGEADMKGIDWSAVLNAVLPMLLALLQKLLDPLT